MYSAVKKDGIPLHRLARQGIDVEQLKAADHRAIRAAFDALYEHRYAHHSPDEPVEMVNIRVRKRVKPVELR